MNLALFFTWPITYKPHYYPMYAEVFTEAYLATTNDNLI